MRYRKIGCILAALTAAVLAACGGGGGSSNRPVTSSETFQMRTAWENLVQHSGSRSFQMSAIYSGTRVTGSGTIEESALVSASFDGASAWRKTTAQTITMTDGSKTVEVSTSETLYFDDSLNPLGGESDDAYCVVTGHSIPETARVNDSGGLYTLACYADNSKSTLLGIETASYLLEPDTASSALLKMTLVQRDAAGNATSTDTISIRMTPGGNLDHLSEKASFSDGDTVTVTY